MKEKLNETLQLVNNVREKQDLVNSTKNKYDNESHPPKPRRIKSKKARDRVQIILNKLKEKNTRIQELNDRIKHQSDPKNIIRTLNELQELSTNTKIFELVFFSTKMLADFYLDTGDFNMSLKLYNKLKAYCHMYKRKEEELYMLEQLGYMYRLKKENKTALEQFKQMLQISWELNNKEMELKSYQHMAIEHFYLKNMEKSKYYSTRFHRGMIECDNTMTKKLYKQEAKISFKHTYIPPKIDINTLMVDDEHRKLPSPSEGRHTCHLNNSVKILPYLYYDSYFRSKDFRSSQSLDVESSEINIPQDKR